MIIDCKSIAQDIKNKIKILSQKMTMLLFYIFIK